MAMKQQEIDLGITREENGERWRAMLLLETKEFASEVGIHSTATVVWWDRMHHTCSPERCRRLRRNDAKAVQTAIDTQHAQVFTPETVAELTLVAKTAIRRKPAI